MSHTLHIPEYDTICKLLKKNPTTSTRHHQRRPVTRFIVKELVIARVLMVPFGEGDPEGGIYGADHPALGSWEMPDPCDHATYLVWGVSYFRVAHILHYVVLNYG
jgi:hypothetical protein